MKPAIVCERLGKSFPLGKREPMEVLRHQLFGKQPSYSEPFWALRDVSFEVERGGSLGIVGRNGSGKSTLLQILTGILPPSEGSFSVHGKIAALLELGSGFDPEYTGRENVYMNGAVLGLTERQIDQRFASIEAFADIGRFIEEPVRMYSSGMFVRLAFSVAIHVDPEILVVDEALSVGDARFAAKCMRRIRDLRESGVTLLFVSHDVSSVRSLCDKALWLVDGRVRKFDGVFQVTSHYMEYLFADELVEQDAPPEKAVIVDSQESVGAPDVQLELQECNVLERVTDPDQAVERDGGFPMPALQSEPEGSELHGVINHWGSHIGSISNHRFSAASGSSTVIHYGEPVTLEVGLEIPEGAIKEHLSLAFSIKDLRGTDLLVCTTNDENRGFFRNAGSSATVRFEFNNRLTPGKYLLVLALEDRSAPVISYYEYVEGVSYFASISEDSRFGIFNLPVRISMQETV